jgi:hypothetical protein
LDADSAAIDVGVNAGVNTDIDGDQCPIDGDLDGSAAVDIGADEFTLHHIYLPLTVRNSSGWQVMLTWAAAVHRRGALSISRGDVF